MADDEIQRLSQILEDGKRRRRDAQQAQQQSEQAPWALEEQIRRPLITF